MEKTTEWLISAHVQTDKGPATATWPAMDEETAFSFASTIILDRSRTDLDASRRLRIEDMCRDGRYRDAVQLWNSIMENEERDLQIITIDQRNDETTDTDVDADTALTRRAG